jgi:hypothetical protein
VVRPFRYPGPTRLNGGAAVCAALSGEKTYLMRTAFSFYAVVIAAGFLAAVLVALSES